MRRTKSTLVSACIFALGAATMTSCIINEESTPGTKTGIKFIAGIEGVVPTAGKTRTTGGGDTCVVGDGVGIYMLTNRTTMPSGIITGGWNERYNVADASTGTLSPDASATPIEYPASGNVDFVAYYPYTANVNKNGIIYVPLTDQSNPAAIDVLTAKTSGIAAETGGAVNLTFKHALSKITINVKAGTNIDPADVAAISDVKLSSTPGSVQVNIDGGAVTDGRNIPIALAKASNAAANYDATFSAIVAPQSGGGRYVTLVVGERNAVWSIPEADTFTPGQHYTYWGEIVGESFRVDATNITTWNNNDKGQATSNLPAKIQQNHRITWDGANSRYILTTDPTDAGLYFLFGSVTGIFSGHGANQVLPDKNSDTFDATTEIAWNPTDAADWATVPVYDNYPAEIDRAYHTAANVKAGKGDPCRLVGLDLAKIKSTATASLYFANIDNGKWRLPTPAEEQAYSGRKTDGDYTAHWTTLSGSGVMGGMFPNATDGDETTFLPAAGFRDNSTGAVKVQGSYGVYWSSSPHVSATTHGLGLYFISSLVNPLKGDRYAYGFNVRCVRQ